MRVIDISEITIASINGKYGKNHYTGRLFLNSKYRDFKKELVLRCRKCKIVPPYSVEINISSASDIDNSIKPILDSLQTKGVITDDKYVEVLTVIKQPIKRGKPGSIKVTVKTIDKNKKELTKCIE
jgi:Holliday junction resolvase RusA-like endonuclease